MANLQTSWDRMKPYEVYTAGNMWYVNNQHLIFIFCGSQKFPNKLAYAIYVDS